MTPEERVKAEKEGKSKGWVYPYCGGCGHRYYMLPMCPPDEAKRGKCRFCHEDAQEGSNAS